MDEEIVGPAEAKPSSVNQLPVHEIVLLVGSSLTP